MVRRYGKFDVDAFADVNGVNSRAPAHHSSVNPPFGRLFEGQRVWAFPPPSLAARFLDEARAWNASAVLALVPEAAFRETAEGWMRLRTFTFNARVFTRWHWGKRCRCRASGIEWVLIRLTPNVHGGSAPRGGGGV
eukprot:3030516-Rhodomonas_salina.1